MAQTRREFLRNTACGTLAATAMVRGMDKMFLVNALAKPTDPTDYKALVCVFLFGGNDANNVVIPYTDYPQYDAIRGQGVGLAIPQDRLFRITVPSHQKDFGLHPSLSGLANLWSQGKVAILANTGNLIRPISRAEYESNVGRPYQLFSHSDQVTANQTSYGQGHATSGWGGALADRIHGSQTFPVVTSINGVQMFNAGVVTRPLIIGAAPTRLDQVLNVTRNYPELSQIVNIERADGTRTIVANSGSLIFDALTILQTLRNIGDPTLTTTFPNTGFANQLKQVAKMIKIAPQIGGVQRQIFFVAIGGFDTHNNQIAGGDPTSGQHANLWTQVDQALTAFYNCIDGELGLASQVTAFTMSDFSRTLKPNDPGTPQVGTDHAWGSHHLVVGGAVNGGDFYGTFPQFTLGGDDDVDNGTGARGRFLPTTSLDQYGATLALWYGLNPSDLPLVFPNINNYSTVDLGFMQPPMGPVAANGRRSLLRRALGL